MGINSCDSWNFKVILTVLFFPLCQYCQAQINLGLEIGGTNNSLNTNISNRSSTQKKSGLGLTASLLFQYKVNNWLYAEALPGITQKNYSFERTDSLTGAFYSYKNNYIQLPFLAHFVFGRKLLFFFEPGLFASYWLSGYQIGKIPNIFAVTQETDQNGQVYNNLVLTTFNHKYQFNSIRDNRIELGYVVGSGLEYHFNKDYEFMISARYYQSLTDQQKKYMVNQYPRYNETLTFTFSAIYKLR